MTAAPLPLVTPRGQMWSEYFHFQRTQTLLFRLSGCRHGIILAVCQSLDAFSYLATSAVSQVSSDAGFTIQLTAPVDFGPDIDSIFPDVLGAVQSRTLMEVRPYDLNASWQNFVEQIGHL
jgi:hypothetical protein